MADSDGIEARLTSYVQRTSRPPSIRIGDDVYVFPPGTTNEEAQSVMNAAWALYMKDFTVNHDPGDEDRSER